MATFKYQESVLSAADNVISAKLGPTNGKFVDADLGYPVKLAADSQFNKCVSGDQIEGFVTSLSAFTVEDRSFGSVQIGGFKSVTVTGPIAIGDYVMAGTGGKLLKETAVTGGDATTVRTYRWRYVSGAVSGSAVDCVGTVLRVA